MTTMASTAPRAGGGARTFVRRLYFYGMALISLIAMLIAADNLLRVLDTTWLRPGTDLMTGNYVREAIAGNGGVLLVATPIFLLHWAMIQHRRTPDELGAGMRKFFIYVTGLVCMGYALSNGAHLLEGIAQLAFGMPVVSSAIWPSGWLHHLGMGAAALGLQVYCLRVVAVDGDLGQETGVAGTWRRIYQTLAGVLGLTFVILGAWGLLESALQLAFERANLGIAVGWWRPRLADRLTLLLLGTLLLRANWLRWQALTVAHPQEGRAPMRRFYLYAAVIGGALTVLIPGSLFLRDLLRAAMQDLAWRDPALIDRACAALAAAPIGLWVWRWHWQYLQREAATYGESAEGALIRRLYYYAVAATGLVFVWLGAVDLVQVLVDMAAGRLSGTLGDALWVYPLAAGLSRLVVAAPVWAYHWQVVERVARQDDRAGQAERGSGPRRVYLYGVALAGGVLILFYLAQVVYRLLLWLLGDPSAGFSGAGPAGDLARAAIAAVIWSVHVWAIRRDARLGAEAPAPVPTLDEQRAILEARVAELEIALADARAALAKLPPAA
jgi:hypothetical protein